MKCTTHIERVRQKYASNQQLILQTVGITWEEYCQNIFEIGIRFLQEHYPEDDKEFSTYFKNVSRDKKFWNWWRFEWMKWEGEMIDHFKELDIEITYEIYNEEMQPLIMDGFTEQRFYQDYQKPKLTLNH